MAEVPAPGGRDEMLVIELQQALAAAREQQALLRASLMTVAGFLERDVRG